ncbi:MAG TPA: PDZ domain-containing protein, partial [Thermoanaerobaculia bacterium]|nr:PDZ domain-containing protein [Thermoanaerobaculia bacterium]
VGVEKGSPADVAGIKAGDIVAKVANRSTRTMPLWEIQELLAGQPGTKLQMELIRVGETVKAAMDLKPFDAPPVSLSEVEGVAVLRVPTFDEKTAADVRDALSRNAGKIKDKLVIDVRGVSSGNP